MNLNCAGRQMVEVIRVRQYLNAAKTIKRGITVLCFTMGPWDIPSLGIQIPIFSGLRREITNNYVKKNTYGGKFVEKIHVGQ